MTKEEREKLDIERINAMRAFERELCRQTLPDSGIPGSESPLICGIDEAGRGPLAGPVAAAAVILPPDFDLPFLNDSKKVTPKRRDVLFDEIRKQAVAYAVCLASPERIDEINILQATLEAMRNAVESLSVQPDFIVADAVTVPGIPVPQKPVIKGDARCASIAAASILAKVTRDRLMEEYDRTYPAYGFAGHKGYGTAAHIKALKENGPCPIHRRSFITHFV